ncbi:MAG: 50S ribosomal protein L11 methyltransferase [Clostridiales bacterium]|nr:50S ribosomal protein L11 methyltransferase [Clostridiales bacterium]
MQWTEVNISVGVKDIELAESIAIMAVPYGIYVEDYSDLEAQALEIAHIDLIDEELLKKERTKAIIHLYISPEDNPAEAVAFLSERYSAEGIAHEIQSVSRNDEDWANSWKAYFKPMEIGNRLLIRPLWENVEDTHGRAVLNIEPGAAFGTGTHNTTRLCLEALDRCVKPGNTLLDIGCGSGILSIAALLLGATKAVAVDIDALAVKTAVANGVENGFSEPEFTVIQGNLADKVSGKYSVITANIVADAIIALAPDALKFMDDASLFIASGIIDLRADEVITALEGDGYKICERHDDGGWVCLVCKKI